MFEQILDIGPNDVMIAISFPRYSTKVINAVKYAHAQGSTVIALTDSRSAPIAADATHILTAQSDMASFVDSLAAPLSVINTMLVDVTRQMEQQVKERFDRLERIWDEYDVYSKR